MSESTVDKSWEKYWSSNGTFSFDADEVADVVGKRLQQEADIQDRLATIYKGQNRLLRRVAEAVDAAWPPDQYQEDGLAPGDIVRQFIVTPKEGAAERVQDLEQ
jgi:hypothetical protein